MRISRVPNIYNFQTNKQKNFSKINFGNNSDKNRDFLSIISAFPNVKDSNPSNQEKIEYDKCYEKIKKYLEKNGLQNINLGEGLVNLAGLGHYKIVELLLKKYNVDVNYKDSWGSTSIMYAAMKGHTKTIEILARYGADVNTKNKIGYNALMLASMDNHPEAMDKILSLNPVYINDTDSSGKTALINAVILENKEAVEKLIAYGADVNIQSKGGKTALMYAAGNLNREIMNKLIEAGADKNIVNCFGETAEDIYAYIFGMLRIKIEMDRDKSVPADLAKRYSDIKQSLNRNANKNIYTTLPKRVPAALIDNID